MNFCPHCGFQMRSAGGFDAEFRKLQQLLDEGLSLDQLRKKLVRVLKKAVPQQEHLNIYESDGGLVASVSQRGLPFARYFSITVRFYPPESTPSSFITVKLGIEGKRKWRLVGKTFKSFDKAMAWVEKAAKQPPKHQPDLIWWDGRGNVPRKISKAEYKMFNRSVGHREAVEVLFYDKNWKKIGTLQCHPAFTEKLPGKSVSPMQVYRATDGTMGS